MVEALEPILELIVHKLEEAAVVLVELEETDKLDQEDMVVQEE